VARNRAKTCVIFSENDTFEIPSTHTRYLLCKKHLHETHPAGALKNFTKTPATMGLISLIPLFLGSCYSFTNKNIRSEKNLNLILKINLGVFFAPLAFAFVATLPDGNMWSENGPGVVL
jgi:hypothetical protein